VPSIDEWPEPSPAAIRSLEATQSRVARTRKEIVMTIIAFIRNLLPSNRSVPGRSLGEGPFAAYRVGAARHPHIAPWMESAFADLVHASQQGGPFALAPCLVNGTPSAAIVTVERRGSRSERWTALFVAITPAMAIDFPPIVPATDGP
jgi:hypothetical protein